MHILGRVEYERKFPKPINSVFTGCRGVNPDKKGEKGIPHRGHCMCKGTEWGNACNSMILIRIGTRTHLWQEKAMPPRDDSLEIHARVLILFF